MLAQLPSGISVNPEAVESVRMGVAPTGQQAVIIEMYGGKVEGRNFCVFPEVSQSLQWLYETIVKAIDSASRGFGPDDDEDDEDPPTYLGRNRFDPSPSNN